MNIWKDAVVTVKGRALLAKLIEGNTLDITRAETGAGTVETVLLQNQLAVTEPQQAPTFRQISYPEDGKCALTCALTNDDLTTGYKAHQLGIYATDPDDGEILFFIIQSTEGTEIPSATEMPGFTSDWTLYFRYGQADEVNVTVDPAGSVKHAEMVAYVAEALEDAINAHNEDEDPHHGKFAAASHNHNASDIDKGMLSADRLPTVPETKGGTGQTTLNSSAKALINALAVNESDAQETDYIVAQYAGGGNTITSYHRRPLSAFWAWIKGKADAVYAKSSHTHTKSQITDFPTSMPASDVYSWAKASSKPTYTYSEVGAAAASHTHNYAGSSSAGGDANNALKLGGYSAAEAASNSTIALRSAYGYLYATYFNQSSDAETPTTSSYIVYTNSDGFFRKSSLANIKSILGLGSAAYTASTAYAAASHSHTKSQITDFPSSMPASDVYSWAKASSKPSYSWGEITGKPSTFAPSAHSHAQLAVHTTGWNTIRSTTDPLKVNFFDVYDDGGPTAYGNVMEIVGLSAHWQPQLWFDAGSVTHLRVRGKAYDADTFGEWNTVLDSNNYTSYAPTKTGGGASGTWGISITGSAGSATKATQDASGNTITSTYEKKHSTKTATLAAGSWSSNQQTVSVSGVTASNIIVVTPAPASHEAWCNAGVYASAQASGTVTFKCKTTPSAALTANIVILGG